MALPASGQILMSQIAAELGISPVGLTLNDSRVRQLAGKPSGPVWFSDFWGKSNAYTGSISIGNSGTTSGVYRPNASSGWVYGSFSNPVCYGVPILWFTWEVDRHGGAGNGELSLSSSVSGSVRLVLNGNSYTCAGAGNGNYTVPYQACQYLEDNSSASIQIYKA